MKPRRKTWADAAEKGRAASREWAGKQKKLAAATKAAKKEQAAVETKTIPASYDVYSFSFLPA